MIVVLRILKRLSGFRRSIEPGESRALPHQAGLQERTDPPAFRFAEKEDEEAAQLLRHLTRKTGSGEGSVILHALRFAAAHDAGFALFMRGEEQRPETVSKQNSYEFVEYFTAFMFIAGVFLSAILVFSGL